MICPKCGQSILNENPRFCPSCGADLTLFAPAAVSAGPTTGGEDSTSSTIRDTTKPRRSRLRRSIPVLISLAFLVLLLVFTTLNGSQPTVLLASGTSVEAIPPGIEHAQSIDINNPATLSGGYASNATTFFYILNASQYNLYWTHLSHTIWAAGTSLDIPSGYFHLREFNLTYGGVALGAFVSSAPTAFYFLTPAQFAALNSTGTPPSDPLYYLAPTTQGNISQSVSAPGTYYAVFYPEGNESTSIRVTSDILFVYALPPSASVYSASGTTAQFSVKVKAGTYYLIWYNPSSSVANVTVSQPIEVR